MRRSSRALAVLQLLTFAATLALLACLPGAADSAGVLECRSWPTYACEETRTYGNYVARVWKSLDEAVPSVYRVVTIERDGEVLACQDWATGLGPLSGIDIDRSGYPNLIIESYSGGAHCCFATAVYDLGEDLVPIGLPASPGGNAPGEFVDLNGDGIYEFQTTDDSFAYAYCAFAGSPAVRVILAYSPTERRFVPASAAYPDLYREDIARDVARAQAALVDEADAGWDGTGKCGVLPLVLDYLYSGRVDSAWAALESYYPPSDRDAFRAEIEAAINASPYYAAP